MKLPNGGKDQDYVVIARVLYTRLACVPSYRPAAGLRFWRAKHFCRESNVLHVQGALKQVAKPTFDYRD
jgi:hypothetical protein